MGGADESGSQVYGKCLKIPVRNLVPCIHHAHGADHSRRPWPTPPVQRLHVRIPKFDRHGVLPNRHFLSRRGGRRPCAGAEVLSLVGRKVGANLLRSRSPVLKSPFLSFLLFIPRTRRNFNETSLPPVVASISEQEIPLNVPAVLQAIRALLVS